MSVQGYCDPQFQAVADEFAALLDAPQARGLALCVQVGGTTVLDLWGGVRDKDNSQPWQRDTLVNLFSCTKPFAAVALLQLVAEGKLQLDTPIAEYWQEFAQAGKQAITLRHVLSHQAGVTALTNALQADDLFDWPTMTAAIAAQAPAWPAGQTHGYAPITYGWLTGELLRRVDGRSVGDSVVARSAAPLGLDFFLGLPEQEDARVAHLSRGKGDMGDEAARRLLSVTFTQPKHLSTLAFTNPPSLMTSTNKPQWRRMQQPAANGQGHARSLAGFYQGLLAGQLLAAELLTEATREYSQGEDHTLLTATRFGLGFMLDQPIANATFGMGPQAFGHPGAGGSLGFADPERQVAFGFVTNLMGPYVLMDPRAQRLAKAVAACL